MNEACANTDRELWREREGDYYADSIHITKEGGIGINCGGRVYVRSLRDWHRLAMSKEELDREAHRKTLDAMDDIQAFLGVDS